MIVNSEKLSWLVEYTRERSSVYYKKEVLKVPPPWTTHPELTYFKFTNVKRFLDRESKWSINNIINNDNLTQDEKALNVALFIIINTGVGVDYYLGGPVKYSKIEEVGEKTFFDSLREIEEVKQKQDDSPSLVNTAYFLSSTSRMSNTYCSEENRYYMTGKAEFIWKFREYFINSWKSSTFKEAFEFVKNVPSFGNFIGYQALTTMSYSKDTKFTDDEFILCGPGTLNGLKFLFEDYNEYKPEDLIEYLRCNIKDICKSHGLSWDIEEWLHFLPEENRLFTRQDWTNAMCELQKLTRLRIDDRMRKRYYKFSEVK